MSATVTYRITNNLIQNIPTGSDVGTWTPAGRTECADATGKLGPCTATAPNGFSIPIDEPFFALNLPEEPAGVTINDRPGATQKFYGVDFSVVKRLSDHWMFRANFGWNSFKNYLTADSIQDPNNLWAQGGQNCGSPPQTSCLAAGYSSKTSVFLNGSWQFNVNGLYQAPLGVELGANFFGRQGYPNPYYVRVRGVTDAAGVSSTYLIQIANLDTYRYDNVYELDLRIARPFNLSGVQVIPTAEIFNVANANTVLQRVQRTGDYRVSTGNFTQYPFFNQILEVQSPRILRLGLTVNF